METAGELAQLVVGFGEEDARLLEVVLRRRWIVRERAEREIDPEEHSSQLLLRAVVQVPLELLPSVVGGAHDSRTRGAHLLLSSLVRDSLRDEVTEAPKTRLRARGESVTGWPDGCQRAEQLRVHD